MKNTIYLAAGCFWGTEKLFSSLYGVTKTLVGFANGNTKDPTYKKVCQGDTGYKECVLIEYDSSIISLQEIIEAYFLVIDPTLQNQQGNDYGTQYQTGIYYIDENSKEIVTELTEKEKIKYTKWTVEILPLLNFVPAEEYHQNYLDKNPFGYCHISSFEIEGLKETFNTKHRFKNPDDKEIKKKLSTLEYNVTQNKATEHPFTSNLYNNDEPGIYVDIITGEPLFSSNDKYLSSCGWPSFDKGILGNKIFKEHIDYDTGYARTEIQSSAGNHLGHRFENDPESPNGTRYCINGASLRFVPYNQMDEEGYSKFKKYVDIKS